ncbi:MAG: RecX family transcriptional regulator [Alistipes sp.]|nr:RecX family transcriptional regulator [Alistipes sp.]
MTPQPRERKTKTAQQALQSLMRLAARSEKSTGDALRLMRTWGVSEAEQRGVLEKLIADRYIDNRRYAEAYAREKSRLAGWGERKIAMQLRMKGVERETISAVLAEVLQDDSMAERLQEKLEKKLRTVKAANDYELRGKLLRYALGLGYDYDMAAEVIEELTKRK